MEAVVIPIVSGLAVGLALLNIREYRRAEAAVRRAEAAERELAALRVKPSASWERWRRGEGPRPDGAPPRPPGSPGTPLKKGIG